jgi:DNA-binding NtrC family response regulator
MSPEKSINSKQNHQTNIKVLLSSGYSDKGQAGEIVDRDTQCFIQKPFDLSQLSQKNASMLGK